MAANPSADASLQLDLLEQCGCIINGSLHLICLADSVLHSEQNDRHKEAPLSSSHPHRFFPDRRGLIALSHLCVATLVLSGCLGGEAPSIGVVERVTEPLEIVEISLPEVFEAAGKAQPGNTEFKVEQEDGPEVQTSLRARGILRIATPGDPREDTELSFKVTGQDASLNLKFVVQTLVGPVVRMRGEALEEGVQVAPSLRVAVEGAQEGLLGKDLSRLAFRIEGIPHPALSEAPPVLLRTDTQSFNVTSLFDYNVVTGRLTLKPLAVQEMKGKLGTSHRATFLLGGSVASEVSLIYAIGSVRGRLVNQAGIAQVHLAGKRIVLRNLSSGFRVATNLSMLGTFQFPAVPAGTYLLELKDASTEAFAIGSFAIYGDSDELEIDLRLGREVVEGATVEKGAQTFLGSVVRSRKLLESLPPERPAASSVHISSLGTDCQTSPGTYSVSGEAMDANISCETNFTVPKGTANVRVLVTVETAEYPGYSPNPKNPYNDTWNYDVTVGSTKRYTSANMVNRSHSTTGRRTYVDECVDVSKLTVLTPFAVGVVIGSTNIGDSALPTNVTVSLSTSCTASEFTLTNVEFGSMAYGRSQWRLFSFAPGNKRSLLRYMSFPRSNEGYTPLRFPLSIEYFPKDAELSKVKLEARTVYGTTVLSENILEDVKGFILTRQPGVLKVSNFLLPPASVALDAPVVELYATATGKVGGKEVLSEPRIVLVEGLQGSQFIPLFEVSQVHPSLTSARFSFREEAKGLDGWGRPYLLNMLMMFENEKPHFYFNDITAMHTARNLAKGGDSILIHSGHATGLEADIRYWDETGEMRQQGLMNGFIPEADRKACTVNDKVNLDCASSIVRLGNKACSVRIQKTNAIDTDPVRNPSLPRISAWILTNRAQLDRITSLGNVEQVFIGNGGIDLLLRLGKCPSSGEPLPGIGLWQNGKVDPWKGHHDHWHLTITEPVE